MFFFQRLKNSVEKCCRLIEVVLRAVYIIFMAEGATIVGNNILNM